MCNEFAIEDVLKDFRHQFDSSNYDPSHPLYSTANKAKLGCFKDECAGKSIEEIIMLRPKMYSIKLHSGDEIKRAKGISKCIVYKTKHEEYQKVLDTMQTSMVNMTILKSTGHQVSTTTFRKRALSAWEDKRCWTSFSQSYPHGHPSTGLPLPKRPRLTLPVSGDVSE